MPTKSYIGIHERAIRAASNKFNNIALYKVFKKALEDKNIQLTQSQRQVLNRYVLEGTLNGLDLEDKKYELHTDDIDDLGFKAKEYKTKYEVCVYLCH